MEVLTSTLIQLSTGIPGLVVAGVTIILMFLALIRKEASLMVVAALLTIPFAYAGGSWAGLLLFVRLLPLFSLGSAFFIGKDDPVFAWSLPLPSFGYLIYILFRLILTASK
jgi:hypothetical protein